MFGNRDWVVAITRHVVIAKIWRTSSIFYLPFCLAITGKCYDNKKRQNVLGNNIEIVNKLQAQ